MNGVRRLNRREILIRLGEASALLVFSGSCVGAMGEEKQNAQPSAGARWSHTHVLPNYDAAIKPAPGTRPELTPLESFFRMDLGVVPNLNGETWKLRIKGLVERPVEMGIGEIRKVDAVHQFATLACITNPVGGGLTGTTRWTGVSLQKLLQQVRPDRSATHVRIVSADGFSEIVSLETLRRDARVMLAYEWDGVPLSPVHGFPLRIFIPDVYGMKQPKWVQSLELIGRAEKGYWVQRGWDAEARIRAFSVIDTTGSTVTRMEKNGGAVVQLGGIAYAGTRGISKVQVQVDGDPWRDAVLRTPLSELTWVIWRFDWPFRAGRHTFTVRCFDGNGAAQTPAEASAYPSGATGFHRIQF